MKIDPVVAGLFYADGQTDGKDMTKLVVAFRNFANAPIKIFSLHVVWFVVLLEGCILCCYRLYCVGLVAVCNVYSPVLSPPVHLICSQSHI